MKRSQPPAVDIVVGNRTTAGVLGSWVWRGEAADSALEVPTDIVDVVRGETIRFRTRGRQPREVLLSVYPEGRAPDLKPVMETPLEPRTLTWIADVADGEYVLALFRSWGKRGDATSFFHIRVRAA